MIQLCFQYGLWWKNIFFFLWSLHFVTFQTPGVRQFRFYKPLSLVTEMRRSHYNLYIEVVRNYGEGKQSQNKRLRKRDTERLRGIKDKTLTTDQKSENTINYKIHVAQALIWWHFKSPNQYDNTSLLFQSEKIFENTLRRASAGGLKWKHKTNITFLRDPSIHFTPSLLECLSALKGLPWI